MAEEQKNTNAEFEYMGYLEGHSNWVTSIATGFS